MSDILKKLRKEVLRISSVGKDGNLQSCFSSLEILWAIYDEFIPLSDTDKQVKEDNKFVLSKGQSNLAFLTVLAEKGCLDMSELDSFCKFGSRIAMQADRTKFDKYVDTSAGSLGHGFPMAVGMAWAKKIKQENGRVFALVGDGEMNEGTMWEAAILASSEKLDNLVMIIDNNESILRMVNIGSFENKLESFGFDTVIVDGHNIDALKAALHKKTEKPLAIIANTKRGWGSKTLMTDRSWFHRFPTKEELKVLCEEVDCFEKNDAAMC